MGNSHSRQNTTPTKSQLKPARFLFGVTRTPQSSAESGDQPASYQTSPDDKDRSISTSTRSDVADLSESQTQGSNITATPKPLLGTPSKAAIAFDRRLDEAAVANFLVWFFYNDLCRMPPEDYFESIPDIKDWIMLAQEMGPYWDAFVTSRSWKDFNLVSKFLSRLPKVGPAITSPQWDEPGRSAFMSHVSFMRLRSKDHVKPSMLCYTLKHPCQTSMLLQEVVDLMLWLNPSGDWIDRKADVLARAWRLKAAYDPLSRDCWDRKSCRHWDSVLSGYRTLETEGFPRGATGVPQEIITLAQHLSRQGKPVQPRWWQDDVKSGQTSAGSRDRAVDVHTGLAPPPYTQ